MQFIKQFMYSVYKTRMLGPAHFGLSLSKRRVVPLSGAGSGCRPAPAFLSPPFLLDVFPVRTGPSPGVKNENLLTVFARGFDVPHQYHAPHPW